MNLKKKLFPLGIIVIWIISSAAAQLALPWTNHAAPFAFLFGNEIDTHQQSLVMSTKQLNGFLYIHFTGETIDGIPVAEHTDCAMMAQDCQAGWKITGDLAEGTYTGHNMDNHMPQFCVQSDPGQDRLFSFPLARRSDDGDGFSGRSNLSRLFNEIGSPGYFLFPAPRDADPGQARHRSDLALEYYDRLPVG